jgi:hypothetical protein
MPLAWILANLSTLAASERTATRPNFDFWARNSSMSGRPTAPLAPMTITEGAMYTVYDLCGNCWGNGILKVKERTSLYTVEKMIDH